jgi:DNA-binding HxlR family transcriptional regulator
MALVKSYGQRCALARALDLVGERWTLLVVRELLLGPRRYTDLLDGLRGVGTNILAARLADLQAAELVSKRALPPPTAVTVYELTEPGRALASSIRALSEWGEQHAAPATEDQVVRPAWILLSAARRGSKLEVGNSCELRVGRDVFELTGTGRELSVAATSARSPDAVITMEPDLLYALATRRITPQAARKRVEVNGDLSIAARVLEGLSGCASSN